MAAFGREGHEWRWEDEEEKLTGKRVGMAEFGWFWGGGTEKENLGIRKYLSAGGKMVVRKTWKRVAGGKRVGWPG